MSKVVVVGGGAAGMMAAVMAARRGHKVLLLEKNEKLGKKLFITGKGRCNFTNAADEETLMNSVVTNPKFLYSAFSQFTNQDAMQFFQSLGVPYKVERGNRVFPVSDHASDIIDALRRELKKQKVEVRLHMQVLQLQTEPLEETEPESQERSQEKKEKNRQIARCTGVLVENEKNQKEAIQADWVILATGGKSYSSTGSTGDGYLFAEQAGLRVTQVLPGLVPFTSPEAWIPQLQGLSLRNCRIEIRDGKKLLYTEFGEMLFTHFGVSGPTVLSASSYVAKRIQKHPLQLHIDLKPALSEEQLDARILRDFEEEKNKDFQNSLNQLLPKKLIPVVISRSEVAPDKKVHDLSRAERLSLVHLLKDFTVELDGLRGFSEAIITQGGISVREINPTTMAAKKIQRLSVVGEVLDVDAVTGGFNLQIAWSTAFAAASHIGRETAVIEGQEKMA